MRSIRAPENLHTSCFAGPGVRPQTHRKPSENRVTKATKCKTNTWTLSRPRYFLSQRRCSTVSDQTLHRWTGPEATYVTRRPYVRTRMDSGPAQTRIPVAGLRARFTVAIMPRNIDCNLNFGFRPLFGQPRDPLRRVKLEKSCRAQLKSAQETKSTAVS